MNNLLDYTEGLTLRDGIYFSKNEEAISYPESGNEICYQIEANSFWFKHRNQCILTLVQKYSPGALFFDIGGGNGYVSYGLEQAGHSTVLIEPGIKGCLNAKKRGLQNIVCATLESAGFKKDMLPAVGLFDVVEHIEDDLKFMQMIHSYLKENGKVYISVPAFQGLWSNEDRDAGHYRRYTRKSMRRLLEQAGFEVNYLTYIFSILPLPVFLFRSLPSRLGFNKGSNNPEKHLNEHKEKGGLVQNVLNTIWNFELNQIQQGKTIGLGGSCLVVASKKKK